MSCWQSACAPCNSRMLQCLSGVHDGCPHQTKASKFLGTCCLSDASGSGLRAGNGRAPGLHMPVPSWAPLHRSLSTPLDLATVRALYPPPDPSPDLGLGFCPSHQPVLRLRLAPTWFCSRGTHSDPLHDTASLPWYRCPMDIVLLPVLCFTSVRSVSAPAAAPMPGPPTDPHTPWSPFRFRGRPQDMLFVAFGGRPRLS